MKTLVVHNSAGRIISVARIEGKKRGKPKFSVGIAPRRGQSVLELDVKGAVAKKRLGDIHSQFRVDVRAKQLKERSK